MKQKAIKPKIKQNKLDYNPLFIRFLNWQRDKHSIEIFLTDIQASLNNETDIKIIRDRISNLTEDYLSELDKFKEKFESFIKGTISSKEVSPEFLTWLGNLNKYIQETVIQDNNDRSHLITIRDPAGKWFESLICYNFILTFNYFGCTIIKKCPICGSYFAHKGKYAVYCSDECKAKKVAK